LNFLSINRFERKKNIDLAVSAFAILCKHKQNLSDVTLTVAGGYDERLKENVEYLEELRSLAEKEGVSDRVNFITSCSTAERNELLSSCLCVLYTPTVKVTILFFFFVFLQVFNLISFHCPYQLLG
jgi:alpha-1,3/alpha-1,6-mannosyltransferase